VIFKDIIFHRESEMNRIEVQKVKDKSIVLVDLSNLTPDETIKVLPEAHVVISKMGDKSALVITDVTNARYDKAVAEGIKDFVKKNTPYIKASAVVGVEGVQAILLQTAIFIARRDIKTFSNRAEATNWLVNH
jgi:hypothetical protein